MSRVAGVRLTHAKGHALQQDVGRDISGGVTGAVGASGVDFSTASVKAGWSAKIPIFEVRLLFILEICAERCTKLEGMTVLDHGEIVLEGVKVLLVGPRCNGPHTGKVRGALEPDARALVAIFLSRNWEEIRNGIVQLLFERHVCGVDGDLVLGPAELEVIDHVGADRLAQPANGNPSGLLPGFVNHP